MRRNYLVSYDVREDKRLRRVAKTLEGYGVRLQDSVFRCQLTERGMEELRWKLSQLMKEEDDLLVIGLCEACSRKVRSRTARTPWDTDGPRVEIL
ncbi:MAG: CRISPR-associated endonuclease Cas2 [Bryobacteraceae bacterium]